MFHINQVNGEGGKVTNKMLEVKANNYVAIGEKVREYTKPIETCS